MTLIARARRLVLRLLAPGLLEDRGAVSGMLQIAGPSYDPAEALGVARAGSPWLHASVSARASDLAGLPLSVTEGTGSRARDMESHPVLDLAEAPSTTATGEEFRRQQVIDLDLAGNAYAAIIGDGTPTSMLRLHPAHMSVRGTRTRLRGYVYEDEDGRMDLAPEDVLHVRAPSFSDGARMHLGSGKVEILNDELEAVFHLTRRLAEDARVGSPKWLITPTKPSAGAARGASLTPEQLQQASDRFTARLMSRAKVIFQGYAVDAQQLSHKPTDLDPSGTREHARQSVIAVAGMVPVRLGLETANYAQSREMLRIYWQGLQSDARLLDAAWTRLARMMDPRARLYVRHDFSEVGPLQQDRTAAQQRAQVWVESFGLDPAYAAALEGFEDVDFARLAPAQPAEVAAAAEARREQLRVELEAATEALRYGADDPDVVGDVLASLSWALGLVRAREAS